MSSLFERAKYDAFQGDYLTRLLYLNISVFLLFALTNAFTSLFTGNFGLIPNLADDLLALPSRSVEAAASTLDHFDVHVYALWLSSHSLQHDCTLLLREDSDGVPR